MKYATVCSVSAALILAAGLASADPKTYVNATGDVLSETDCGPPHSTTGDPTPDGQGGVCFASGHIPAVVPPNSPPGTRGTAHVSVLDEFVSPTSGFYCQDYNGDALCGDPAAGEPGILFCGTVTLVDSTQGTIGTGNWKPTTDTIIFIDGVLFGSNVFANGCNLQGTLGVKGIVDHISP